MSCTVEWCVHADATVLAGRCRAPLLLESGGWVSCSRVGSDSQNVVFGITATFPIGLQVALLDNSPMLIWNAMERRIKDSQIDFVK